MYNYAHTGTVVFVTFAESEYNESEGAGFMRIGIQLNKVLQQVITIQVITIGITAEGYILFTPFTVTT